MIFYNAGIDDDNDEIDEKLEDLEKDHEREIQQRYARGEIVDYQSNNGNGKSLQHKKQQKTKEETTKEESPHEIYSQKYVGNDYLAEAILIGNKPYFAVSIKRIFSEIDGNVDVDNNSKFPSIVLQESIPLDETTILKPTELISYLNKPYVF